MSYDRPTGINPLTSGVARLATGAGMAMAVTMLANPAALAGIIIVGAPVSTSLLSATVLGSASVAGWACTNTADKARRYDIQRQDAFKQAAKTGTPPILPSNPLLDPTKQPSRLASSIAKFGGTLMAIAGAGFLFSGGAVPAVAATLLVAGLSTRHVAKVGEQAQQYAEQEAIARNKEQMRTPTGQDTAKGTPDPSPTHGKATHEKSAPATHKTFQDQILSERSAMREHSR